MNSGNDKSRKRNEKGEKERMQKKNCLLVWEYAKRYMEKK